MATRAVAAKRGTTWARLCKLALKLPGVEEGRSYGTPALHVRKRFLARLKEDGETVALRVDLDVLPNLSDGMSPVTGQNRVAHTI